MVFSRSLALVVALALLPTGLVSAKGKPKPKAPAPAPAPAAPAAPPLPSVHLQAYSANNLEHLLGPLNDGALPRAELMQMETEYRARLAQGIPEEKPMLEAAINLCLAFGRIMDERERTVAGLKRGSSAASSGALGATRTVRLKDWRDDLQAQREAQEAKARQQQARAADAFVVSNAANAASTAWAQRVQPWRREVQQLLVAERQAELPPAAPGAAPAPPAVAAEAR